MSPQLISSFYISRFAKDVSSPVTDLQAYRAGLVDENGNIIGSESSIDPYEYFVIKLKKIFSQLPMGTTKMSLNSFLSALKLFTEEASWYGIDKTEMTMFLEGYLASQGDGELSHISLLEDMGSGGGAGAIGVPAEAPGANTGGVSGYDPVMGQMQRRKAPVTDSTQMFEVDPDEYLGFKSAKAWKYVPEGPTRNYLQRYQRRNPEGKMAIKNSETGEIHWLNLKTKSLIEDLNLYILDILNESAALVKAYNDSDNIGDDQENVATLTDEEEEMKPVDISGKELKTTAEIIQQRYEEEKETESKGRPQPYLKAGTAEKYATGVEFERSTSVLRDLIKRLGPRGEELARDWHGKMRRSAKKPITAHAEPDYYGLADIKELEDSDKIIVPFDAKNIKARGQKNIDPLEFFKDIRVGGVEGFPLINGIPAHIAREIAKKSGDTEEASRIRREVLDPFYSDREVQDRLVKHFMSQNFPEDSNTQYRLASRKGRELIPIGMPDVEELVKRGISLRTTRGGKQPVEKSQLGVQSKGDFGSMVSERPGPLLALSPEQQREVEAMNPDMKKFGEWLRTS